MSKVYQAIAAVMADLTKEGIQKNSKNTQQNYAFRGIDAVYNALAPKLAKHGLCVLPRVLSRETVERATKSGSLLFYTVLEVEFDFVASEDGSKHTIRTIGEAMDSADKSTNKAMSAAYKYACIQAFCIPTEGDNDADATTHDVAPAASKQVDPQVALNSYLSDISRAKTQADLLKVWKLATVWAKNHSEHLADLIEAKDRKKAEFEIGEAA